LFNATSDSFDGTADGLVVSDPEVPVDGFYITMAAGEKVVNAVATIAGQSFFGTNQPATPSANSCDTNLGIARGYRISPFTANGAFSEFEGGGLPPTPVYGVVEIIREGVLDNEGNQVVDQVPFCIGCGGTGSTDAADRGGITGDEAGPLPPECGSISSLEACKAIINVQSDRHRNYWYFDQDQ
jgi:type IV pilus assembly protein PilY1